MAINRKTVRTRLAALLKAAVPSASQVIDHYTNDFGGISPTVMVVSGGSMRPPLTARGQATRLYLAIQVFVSAKTSDAWTDDQAEDLLDQIEYEIGQALDSSQVQNDGTWDSISQDSSSLIDKVVVNDPYLFESIPITIEVLR